MAVLDEATELALSLGVAARIFVSNEDLENVTLVAPMLRDRLKAAGVVFSEYRGLVPLERFGEIVPVRGRIVARMRRDGMEYTWEL